LGNEEIIYGSVDIEAEELDFKKAKVTIYIDGEVLLAAKKEAKESGSKYQSLINEALRERFLNEQSLKRRVEALEAKVARLSA
jgi:hypothetical protein